jgi:predicted  nucleic acid-binding Zn-ribbon protein
MDKDDLLQAQSEVITQHMNAVIQLRAELSAANKELAKLQQQLETVDKPATKAKS